MHPPDSRRRSSGRRFGRVIVPAVLPVLWLAGATACSSSNTASTTTTSAATATTGHAVKATAGNAAFCQSYLTAEQKLVTDASSTATQSTDTAAASLVVEIQTTYQALTDSAPADIKPQFDTVNTVIQRARSAQDLSAAALPADAAAARDQITEWTKTNCGFDPTTVTPS